jgi:drug/metabolite transporter (DMT)-like permease
VNIREDVLRSIKFPSDAHMAATLDALRQSPEPAAELASLATDKDREVRAWAAYAAAYLDRYPTLAVSAMAMLAAAAFLGAPALGEGLPEALLGFGPAAWLAVGYVGVSSGVGYVCWLFALGRASPTRVTVFFALSPLTAIVLGGLALGEGVTTGLPTGAALVALSLWLTNRQGAGVAKR